MASTTPSLAGALRDRYVVERELGRGGMATVYLAHDLRHRRLVAIKVVHPDLGHALGAERFLREIEVVADLAHPHILPLYDSGDRLRREGALLGEPAKGREWAERALALDPDEGALLYNVACMYALQGGHERAIELLELAVAKGYRKPREWIERDADLDSLHGLARFKAFLERL